MFLQLLFVLTAVILRCQSEMSAASWRSNIKQNKEPRRVEGSRVVVEGTRGRSKYSVSVSKRHARGRGIPHRGREDVRGVEVFRFGVEGKREGSKYSVSVSKRHARGRQF